MIFAVAILAAGRSSRMGSPKLLLPWRNTSVFGYLAETWRGLGASQIIPVCAADSSEVHAELDRLGVAPRQRITNPRPELGMWSSIQCAARWTGWNKDASHFVLTLGDQPHVQRATLKQLITFAGGHPDRICQPVRNGHLRHPVVLPRFFFTELGHSSAGNLREFLKNKPNALAGFESTDEGLDLDIDSPVDYEKALLLSEAHHSTITVGQTGNLPHSEP